MLREGNLLHANGRPLALEAQADEALRDVFLSAGNADAAIHDKSVAVRLNARDGDHFVTHVLPLTSGARRQAGASYAAVAAVFVQKAQDSMPGLEALAQQFGLSPAESRVLIAIMDFGGVAEVAAALKLSPATVRTHLRHVFEKTGVRRQADLVKLVASYPSSILTRHSNGAAAPTVAAD
jgi:DNA-binding CsgD family transcriptional regulator